MTPLFDHQAAQSVFFLLFFFLNCVTVRHSLNVTGKFSHSERAGEDGEREREREGERPRTVSNQQYNAQMSLFVIQKC